MHGGQEGLAAKAAACSATYVATYYHHAAAQFRLMVVVCLEVGSHIYMFIAHMICIQ